MTDRLVWLPFEPSLLGDPPTGLRYEVVDPTRHVPSSVGEVRFYVPPYMVGPKVSEVLPQMTSLEVVQTLTAGVDNVRAQIPAGRHPLQRPRHPRHLDRRAGAHPDPGQPARHPRLGARPGPSRVEAGLAARRSPTSASCSSGTARSARRSSAGCEPFEVEVTRVARTARDGVHPISALPGLLPTADVVVLVVPLTDETRGLVDAAFLAAMPDGSLLVNVARGPVVDNDALVAELTAGRLRAAVDVVDPEPVPPDHPFWDAPGLLISPARRGSEQCDVAASPSVGARPAAPLRGR